MSESEHQPEQTPSESTASPLFGQILQFLDNAGLEYDILEPGRGLRVAMELDNARYNTMFLLGESNFIALTTHTFRAPKSKRTRILDILNRINYDLAFGNFELDNDDGEVRFRVGYPHQKNVFPTEFVGPFVFMGFGMMNRFWPVIQAVCWTNISAEQALKDALDQQRNEENQQEEFNTGDE